MRGILLVLSRMLSSCRRTQISLADRNGRVRSMDTRGIMLDLSRMLRSWRRFLDTRGIMMALGRMLNSCWWASIGLAERVRFLDIHGILSAANTMII